jgi:hypothetical protein
MPSRVHKLRPPSPALPEAVTAVSGTQHNSGTALSHLPLGSEAAR